jgi:cephalosporin hydroxylase
MTSITFQEIFDSSTLESTKYKDYLYFYESMLRRYKPKVIIEFGMRNGGFLLSCKRFIETLQSSDTDSMKICLIGIDLNPNAAKLSQYGIHVIIGDLTSDAFLNSLPDQILAITGGQLVDMVIDDGPHFWSAQTATLRTSLMSLVNNEAVIVVEDTHTSYHPSFEGEPGATPFMEIVKTSLDVINSRSSWLRESNILSFQASNSYKESPLYRLVQDHVHAIEVMESIVAFKIDKQKCREENIYVKSASSINSTVDDYRHKSMILCRK